MATAPKSEILHIAELVSYQDGSVVSRQITKADAGNVTLFAFDKDQELSEHTAPFGRWFMCWMAMQIVPAKPFENRRCHHHASQRTACPESADPLQNAADDDP
jgi:hypothetical protein